MHLFAFFIYSKFGFLFAQIRKKNSIDWICRWFFPMFLEAGGRALPMNIIIYRSWNAKDNLMFAYVHWIFEQSQFKFETVWIFIQRNLCIEFGVTFKNVSICVGAIIPVSYV